MLCRLDNYFGRIALATVLGALVGAATAVVQYLNDRPYGYFALDVSFFLKGNSVFGGAMGYIIGVVWAFLTFAFSPPLRT